MGIEEADARETCAYIHLHIASAISSFKNGGIISLQDYIARMNVDFEPLQLHSSRFPETQSNTHLSIDVCDPWDYLAEHLSFFLNNAKTFLKGSEPHLICKFTILESFKPKGSSNVLSDVVF